MPDRLIDLLVNFLEQNNGLLSNRAKEKEFQALTEKEISQIEKIFNRVFRKKEP